MTSSPLSLTTPIGVAQRPSLQARPCAIAFGVPPFPRHLSQPHAGIARRTLRLDANHRQGKVHAVSMATAACTSNARVSLRLLQSFQVRSYRRLPDANIVIKF